MPSLKSIAVTGAIALLFVAIAARVDIGRKVVLNAA